MKGESPAGRLSPARAARIAAAGIMLALACYGFIAEGPCADSIVRIIARWQLLPSLAESLGAFIESSPGVIASRLIPGLAVSVGIIAFTALFGRWYCAFICPLGLLQDIAFKLGRKKIRYKKSATTLRAISALLAFSLILAALAYAASWLDPWSLFGRLMAYDAQSAARFAARLGVPEFNPWVALISAAVPIAIIALAAIFGRWFCGNLCPVGSLLGLLSLKAPFRIRLENSSCVSCGACAARCPSACIDLKKGRIDASHCVNCLACLDSCPAKALRYGRRKAAEPAGGPTMSRARFLAALGGGGSALALAVLPGRAFVSGIAAPGQATVPPGSVSLKRFLESCTACGLCAARCPSKVLQPSLGQLGLRGLLIPRLDYSVSYCQYECTTCLEVCPSGAILRMSLDQKKLTKIGNAELIRERCIVITNKTRCGACAEHCPTGAVRMVEVPGAISEPYFSSDICIGCGACHHICPVLPEKAIKVSGLPVHQKAERPPMELFDAPPSGEGDSRGGFGEFPF